jgi:hypothetical protein
MSGKRFGWMIVAFIGAACGGEGGRGSFTPPDDGIVDGTVTGAAHEVTVTLTCEGLTSVRTAVTDTQGRFVFSHVPVASCSVAPGKPGFRFDPPGATLDVEAAHTSSATFAARPVLQVRGSDLSGGAVNLGVTQVGEVVEEASVRINGQAIPYSPAAGLYAGTLIDPVAAGGILSLEVTFDGASVTGVGLVPEEPVLIAPVEGEYRSSGEELIVTWASNVSPDAFVVVAGWSCGDDCGTATTFEASGSARTLAIPAGALPAGEIELSVFAYNDGALSGDYEPAETSPGMNIRSASGPVGVIIGEEPSRSVSGTISGADAGVRVELECPGGAGWTAFADEGGAYAFESVPATSCIVTPAREGYTFDPPSVTLPAGSTDQGEVDFEARAVLQVRGTAITRDAANVEVLHGGQLVDDATVLLNGQAASFRPSLGVYALQWPSTLTTGSTVALEVSGVGASVSGTGVLPEPPVLTAPVAGTLLAPGSDLAVAWASASSPDGFSVDLQWSCGPSCGAGRSFVAPGSARDLTVPAASLPSGEFTVFVSAINDGVLTGDYDPFTTDVVLGPGMNIVSSSARVVVSR